jgi:hypothetical protein
LPRKTAHFIWIRFLGIFIAFTIKASFYSDPGPCPVSDKEQIGTGTVTSYTSVPDPLEFTAVKIEKYRSQTNKIRNTFEASIIKVIIKSRHSIPFYRTTKKVFLTALVPLGTVVIAQETGPDLSKSNSESNPHQTKCKHGSVSSEHISYTFLTIHIKAIRTMSLE